MASPAQRHWGTWMGSDREPNSRPHLLGDGHAWMDHKVTWPMFNKDISHSISLYMSIYTIYKYILYIMAYNVWIHASVLRSQLQVAHEHRGLAPRHGRRVSPLWGTSLTEREPPCPALLEGNVCALSAGLEPAATSSQLIPSNTFAASREERMHLSRVRLASIQV